MKLWFTLRRKSSSSFRPGLWFSVFSGDQTEAAEGSHLTGPHLIGRPPAPGDQTLRLLEEVISEVTSVETFLMTSRTFVSTCDQHLDNYESLKLQNDLWLVKITVLALFSSNLYSLPPHEGTRDQRPLSHDQSLVFPPSTWRHHGPLLQLLQVAAHPQ